MIEAKQLEIGAAFLGKDGTYFTLVEIVELPKRFSDRYVFAVKMPQPAFHNVELTCPLDKALQTLNSAECVQLPKSNASAT